jgi:hypothetical protein
MRHVHWRPKDLKSLPDLIMKYVLMAVESAAKVLKRPSNFQGIELVQRNWLPTHHAQAVYAISYILLPGQADKRGLVNQSDKEVVAGGTGWAVEMAIQMKRFVYVFDMNSNVWFTWDYISGKFDRTPIPTLMKVYSGIGARKLTPEGIKAIEDVYLRTFQTKLL